MYEASGKARRVLKARELWQAVIDSQTETGNPYILYKVTPQCTLKFSIAMKLRLTTGWRQDACNIKSNQKNLGTIKCSNLCTVRSA